MLHCNKLYIFPTITVHGFDKAVYEVMEGEKAVINFKKNVKGNTKQDVKMALFGTVTSKKDTAGMCFLDMWCITILKPFFLQSFVIMKT